MEPSTPAEQRAFAVARIKRTPSHPRMKDGRRPPTHVEAVSEGERVQLEALMLAARMMSESQHIDHDRRSHVEPEPEPEPEPEADTEHSVAKVVDPKTEQVPIISPSATPLLSEGFSAKPRRRSRTRSRGRSSQDFAGKTKVTLYPTNAAPSANESSPHESPVSSTPQPTALTSPPPVPPFPANFALLQAHRTLASSEPGMIYPGTSPPTPMLPTLQDIQREALLFRSNSAEARLMSQQLAGPDAYDPLLASPPITPPPLPGKLFRNNTAGGSGGERIAARKVMMRQLGRRLKEAEAEQASGGEDSQPAITARRKQRAIQRLPSTRSTVVENRTLPSHYWVPQVTQDGQQIYYVNTQTGQHYIRDLPIDAEGDLSEVDFHASSSTVVDGRESPSAASPTTPLSPSAAADHGHGQASPIPRSTYNGRSDRPPRIASPRPPHAPGVLLSTSSESADASAPAYLSVSSQEQQEVFPTSPFATPLREKQGSDEEEDARTDHETARRSPWNDAYDREISWVAEIVPDHIPVHDDNDNDDPDNMNEPRNHPSVARHHGHGQASPISRSTYNGRSDTPSRIASHRPPHAPGVPLSTSSESADTSAPAYLSVSTPEQQEVFPTSPFATPLREKQGSDEEEYARTDNETARRSPWNDAYDREISWVTDLVPERIPFHDDNDYDDPDDMDEPRNHPDNETARRPPWNDAYDREISWVAEPVPERIPVHDDDDYDDPDDMDEPRNPSVARHHPDHDEHEHEYDDDSLPRAFHSKNLVVDIEASPEAPKHSQIPPSPSSAIVLPRHLSNDSRIFPAHLSLSSPSPPQLPSPNTEYLEWEESLRVIVPDTKPKKNGESSQSRWDKVKNAIARLGPRNNSIKERANNTDSSTRMENGASLTGASKPDKELRSSYFSSSSGAVSPVPPASSGTLQKYGGDAKLFPFPGIKRLEEERRTRGGGGLSLNASSPDIALPPTLDEFSAISSGSASSRTPHASPEVPRDRKLSRRASDTHLFQKFNSANTPPALSSQSTSPSLDPTSPSTSNLDRLAGTSPTNREGVKTWLRAKNLFPSQSSQPSFSGLQQPVSAPVVITQSGSTDESRNLPDLLDGRKERRVNWEDIWTPTTTNGSAAQSRQTQNVPEPESSTRELPSAGSLTLETPARGRSSFGEARIITSKGDAQSVMYPTRFISPTPDPNLSATPNPTPSLDGYASQSSPSSSSSERFLEPTTSRTPEEMILERLDLQMSHGSLDPTGSTFDRTEQSGTDVRQFPINMSSQREEAFVAPMIFDPHRYVTKRLSKKKKVSSLNSVSISHTSSVLMATGTPPMNVNGTSSIDTTIPPQDNVEPSKEGVAVLVSGSGCVRAMEETSFENSFECVQSALGQCAVGPPTFSNPEPVSTAACTSDFWELAPIDVPLPPPQEVECPMRIQPVPSDYHVARNSNDYSSGEFFGYDTGADELRPLPQPHTKAASKRGQTQPAQSGIVLASQNEAVPMRQFTIVEWQEFSLPDGTRYYVNPTLHTITVVDLRNTERLDAVTRFLDRRDMEDIPPPEWELWFRDSSESTTAFIPHRAWIHHGSRMVLFERPGLHPGSKDADKIESEYHYWLFMGSHPLHAPLPSGSIAEAIDALAWFYASHRPSPFSQEECQELLTQLRSFSHTPAHSVSLVRTLVVSTTLGRIVAWRQGRHWDGATFPGPRKNNSSAGIPLFRTAGNLFVWSGLSDVSWNDRVIVVSARDVALLVLCFSLLLRWLF